MANPVVESGPVPGKNDGRAGTKEPVKMYMAACAIGNAKTHAVY